MNSTNKLVLGAAAISIAVTAGLAVVTNAAPDAEEREYFNQSERSNRRYLNRGKHNRENFEAIKEAIATNDYSTWFELMSDHPKAEDFINEVNFTKLVEAYRLKESGDIEGAKVIMEELGLKRPGGERKGDRKHRRERRPEIREAIQAGNYDAWAELMSDHPRADEFVSQETFDLLQQALELMEAGDKDAAKEIFEQLGLGKRK